jgi:hypothetical protein
MQKYTSPRLLIAKIKLSLGWIKGFSTELVVPFYLHLRLLKSVYPIQVSSMLIITISSLIISIIFLANYCLSIIFLSEFPEKGILLIFCISFVDHFINKICFTAKMSILSQRSRLFLVFILHWKYVLHHLFPI